MIVVQLSGGLGNQLFQYGLGRKLSIKNKTDLYLYTQNLKNFHTKRDLCLDNLNTQFKEIKTLNNLKIIKEKFFHYDPLVHLIKNNSFLKGYWQSEKYFKDIRNFLLKEITPKNKLHDSYYELEKEIINSDSVSIHIRRGDYLCSKNIQFHGVCSLDYYDKSIKHLLEKGKTKSYTFFVFSDDIKWAKENLRYDSLNMKYISKENDSSLFLEEFFLMSKCKHNIIANSTFSWWAAWINQNPNKIVIAPVQWFSQSNKNITKDLIPSNWIRI